MAGDVAGAARWCARLRATTWTTSDVATIAGVGEAAARQVLSTLRGRQALIEVEPDRWRRGPAVEAWLAHRPKTRVGGRAKSYQAAKAVRERLAAADWHARRQAGDLTATSRDYPGQPRTALDMGEEHMRKSDLIDYCEAAERLACCRKTIRRLVAARILPVVRLSATHARIPADAVAELVEKRMQRAMA